VADVGIGISGKETAVFICKPLIVLEFSEGQSDLPAKD
jgi:hypothetical protein